MKANTIKGLIKDFALELENEDNAAFDLWSYLPSYKEAEKYHGDYASEFRPTTADLMIEATIFISHNLNPSESQIKQAGEYYQCPCGGDLHG